MHSMASEAELRRELKRLRSRNRSLKRENKRLKKKNVQLRRIDKQFVRRINKGKVGTHSEKEFRATSVYRYSVAFSNHKSKQGGITFRAEVYTLDIKNKDEITRVLTTFLLRRVGMQNKGLQRMLANASFRGLEDEKMGANDVGGSELNRMTFHID